MPIELNLSKLVDEQNCDLLPLVEVSGHSKKAGPQGEGGIGSDEFLHFWWTKQMTEDPPDAEFLRTATLDPGGVMTVLHTHTHQLRNCQNREGLLTVHTHNSLNS